MIDTVNTPMAETPDQIGEPAVAIFRLPDKTNIEGVKQLLLSLDTDKHGAKMLKHRLDRYVAHLEIAERYWQLARTSERVLNGERLVGTRAKNVEKTARDFFTPMLENSKMLKAQCKVYGIKPEEYETLDSMLEALVARYVTLATDDDDDGESAEKPDKEDDETDQAA